MSVTNDSAPSYIHAGRQSSGSAEQEAAAAVTDMGMDPSSAEGRQMLAPGESVIK
jgi:hypothetical protein